MLHAHGCRANRMGAHIFTSALTCLVAPSSIVTTLTLIWVLRQLRGQGLIQPREDVLRDITDICIRRHTVGHQRECLYHPVDVVIVHLDTFLHIVRLVEVSLNKPLPYCNAVWRPVVSHASNRVDASV